MDPKPDFDVTQNYQQQLQREQEQEQQQQQQHQLLQQQEDRLLLQHQQQQKQEQEQHFHVLAVDDSLIDRKLLEKLLTISSYQVTCVDSGDKALEFLGLVGKTDNIDDDDDDSTACASCSSSCSSLSSQLQQHQEVQSSKVNLIMTDYSMPGMSGYDLLKRVKGSSWKDVPVVVMSSENVPSRINMCLEEGAEEFLLKPVKLADLRKLQSHLILNSMIGQSCENKDEDDNDDEDKGEETNDDENKDKCSNGNNIISKRKAISPECSDPERRPKMKELAVV